MCSNYRLVGWQMLFVEVKIYCNLWVLMYLWNLNLLFNAPTNILIHTACICNKMFPCCSKFNANVRMIHSSVIAISSRTLKSTRCLLFLWNSASYILYRNATIRKKMCKYFAFSSAWVNSFHMWTDGYSWSCLEGFLDVYKRKIDAL